MYKGHLWNVFKIFIKRLKWFLKIDTFWDVSFDIKVKILENVVWRHFIFHSLYETQIDIFWAVCNRKMYINVYISWRQRLTSRALFLLLMMSCSNNTSIIRIKDILKTFKKQRNNGDAKFNKTTTTRSTNNQKPNIQANSTNPIALFLYAHFAFSIQIKQANGLHWACPVPQGTK